MRRKWDHYPKVCGFDKPELIIIDAFITYVDGNDPVWKRDYERTTDVSIMQKRFRDWGTLKYLLRGIEKKMTFIRNV